MNGTVTTPDATDTPEQSASYSLNLDCVNKDGALQGAPINTAVTIKNSAGANASPDMDKAISLKSVTGLNVIKEDVVYWENDDSKLHFIKDLNLNNTETIVDPSSTPFATSGISYSSVPLEDIAMEAHNKEVHIGLGRSQKPKWVGYTNHSSLTGEGAGKLLAVDAEVVYPSSVPHLKKVVKVGNDQYVYGVKEGGTRIWKINSNTGALVAKSAQGTFSNLQSICTDDSSNVYVLDRVGKGKIYKVGVDNLDQIDVTYDLPTAYQGPSGSEYSDIERTSGGTAKIWVAAHWTGGGGSGVDTSATNKFIWNFTDDGTSETKTLDNKMPRMTGGGTSTVGTWVNCVVESGNISGGSFSATSTYIMETFSRSLVKHPSDANAIYWLARYPDNVDQDVSDDNILSVETLWLNRPVADLAGSGTNRDKMAGITEIRTLCLHRIKQDHDASTPDFVPLTHVYHPGSAASGTGGNTKCNISSAAIEANTAALFITADDKIQRMGTDPDTTWDDIETSSPYNIYTLGTKYETVYNVPITGQENRTGVKVNIGFQPSTSNSSWSADTASVALLRQTGVAGIDKVAKEFANDATQTKVYDASVISLGSWTADSNNSGELVASYRYFYKFSLLYDGYQETPLSVESYATNQGNNTHNATNTITINEKTQIPDRASHLKVYRAEASAGANATEPESLYRLVKTIALNKNWTVSGDNAYTQPITDKGTKGASFEADSGLSETLEATLPNYAVSAQLNNVHYIGKCQHTGYIDDASSYIFASKTGKFDVFDWVVDFIKLPTVPTALIGFSGRLYAFDETNTYKLVGSPGLYIEDIFEGVGCLNDDAIVSTDYGMFFADNQNLYWHNGQVAEPIGEAIARGSDTSWQNRDTDYHTRAMYDAKRRSVYFTFKKGSNYYAWAWNIPRKRWDLLSFGNNGTVGTNSSEQGDHEPKGFYLLTDGTINVSYKNIGGDSAGSNQQAAGTTGIVNFLGHASTKRTWTWTSKNLTMGNDTQEKNIRSILLPSRIKAAYNVASGDITSAGNQVGATLKRGTYRMDVAAGDRKTTTFKVRLDANAAGDECGAVGILFKTKRSPR